MASHEHRPGHRPLAGISFMLLASILFSVSDALGKWLTASYPIAQIAFVRLAVGMIILLLLMVFTARLSSLKTRRPLWHIGRSLLSASVMFTMFYGLKHIPLAEFVSLCFSIPFFLAIISPWLLGEETSWQSWLAITTGFIGIVIILRPSPEHIHLAHLVTLLLALTIALLAVSARYLGDTENFYSMNFYLYPAGLLVYGVDSARVWVAPPPLHWLALVSLGICTTIALACYIQANRYARPTTIAPIDYIRIIWTILLGYFIWHEIPDTYTWLGMTIIIISGIYVVSHTGTTPEVDTAQGLAPAKNPIPDQALNR